MKKYFGIIALLILSIFLVACGEESFPTTSSVEICDDYKVTYTAVDDFDTSVYNVDDLKSFAATRMADYISDYGADAVSLDEITLNEENNKILVKMTYLTSFLYSDFNSKTLYCGSYAEAKDGAYKEILDNTSVSDTKGKETFSISSLDEKLADASVILIQLDDNEIMGVVTPAKIKYISSNVSMDGRKNCFVSGHDVAVIIYK